jgi:hypothetical protein
LRRALYLILVLALVGAAAASSPAPAATDADTRAGPSTTTADAPDQSLPSPAPAAEPDSQQPDSGLLTDIKLYFTAPLRWDARDWAWFGGALVAIGAAHHHDTQVRTHFAKNLAPA